MTTSKRSFPLTDQDRQVTPLPGEVDPADARRVAQHVAAINRVRTTASKSHVPTIGTSKTRGK